MSAPADVRVTTTETLFAETDNGLLQQNLPQPDMLDIVPNRRSARSRIFHDTTRLGGCTREACGNFGCSGAGKSTFARTLARQTNLPLIHLDREFWRPGWVETPRGEWRTKVIELVAGDTWIMDGNYGSSLDLRLPRADTLIWFDYPRRRCLWRVVKRIVMTYGQVRPDMAPGCPDQIDLAFLRWIWNFNRRERPALLQKLAASGSHLTPTIFRNDGDAAEFLAKL